MKIATLHSTVRAVFSYQPGHLTTPFQGICQTGEPLSGEKVDVFLDVWWKDFWSTSRWWVCEKMNLFLELSLSSHCCLPESINVSKVIFRFGLIGRWLLLLLWSLHFFLGLGGRSLFCQTYRLQLGEKDLCSWASTSYFSEIKTNNECPCIIFSTLLSSCLKWILAWVGNHG